MNTVTLPRIGAVGFHVLPPLQSDTGRLLAHEARTACKVVAHIGADRLKLQEIERPRFTVETDLAGFEETGTRGISGLTLLAHMRLTCSFAHAGTYGHECGAPATLAAPRRSDMTKGGIYWARRCAACAAEKGGENSGLGAFVSFNPDIHRNEFKP